MIDGRLETAARMGVDVMMSVIMTMVVVRHPVTLLAPMPAPYILGSRYISPKVISFDEIVQLD
jgi:hypothetical protein